MIKRVSISDHFFTLELASLFPTIECFKLNIFIYLIWVQMINSIQLLLCKIGAISKKGAVKGDEHFPDIL
ncbi:hypothetical protein BpHYR1_002065 [Brachionus plicatilis]|uniref:Uncharacterized protein n=1 Tax=Brachionus plicatilis TaxID=10195 RepID=A0A3M7QZR1_BRAPC|nr:hypothetical protein BpHYR1_002065 [Brachionus plicatilis]